VPRVRAMPRSHLAAAPRALRNISLATFARATCDEQRRASDRSCRSAAPRQGRATVAAPALCRAPSRRADRRDGSCLQVYSGERSEMALFQFLHEKGVPLPQRGLGREL
jgi:hypothetical protein